MNFRKNAFVPGKAEKKLAQLRILEIGARGFLYHLLPGQVTWLWTVRTRLRDEGARPEDEFTLSRFLSLRREIQRGKYDLIALTHLPVPLFRTEHGWLKRSWYFLTRLFRKFYSLAPYLLFFVDTGNTPIIVLDDRDEPVIRPQYFVFFPRLRAYFKRELPPNYWHAFLYTSRRHEYLVSLREQPFVAHLLEKLHPLPLAGYREEQLDFPVVGEKDIDIFYVGEENSQVRTRGMALLRRLAAEGFRVELPGRRLSTAEFQSRLHRSWLAFSPQGCGWQCHRTYEAIIQGAVPVMNYPVIERYRPLEDKVHAFYYGCEGDHLLRIMREALSDKARLLAMVNAARRHLMTHYRAEALLAYILALANPDAPVHQARPGQADDL